jgi:hypothetical protein
LEQVRRRVAPLASIWWRRTTGSKHSEALGVKQILVFSIHMLREHRKRIIAKQYVRFRADALERQVHTGTTLHSVSPLRHVDMNEPFICERHVFPLRTRPAGRVHTRGIVPEKGTGSNVDLDKRGSRFHAGIGEQLKPNQLLIGIIVRIGQPSNARQNQLGRHALCPAQPNDIVQGKIILGRRHF